MKFWNKATNFIIGSVFCVTIASATILVNAQAVSPSDSVKKEHLEFIGMVTKFYPHRSVHPRNNWKVAVQVESVILGDFTGKDFTFPLHSPAKSGLQVGQKYRFRAKWIDRSLEYVVEYYQELDLPKSS